jgi:hypothetical protein
MHKNATKCNKIQSKWCINKHGASKIIDTFETYHRPHPASTHHHTAAPTAEHLLSSAPPRSLPVTPPHARPCVVLETRPHPPHERRPLGRADPTRRLRRSGVAGTTGAGSGQREEIGALLSSRVWGPPEPPARGDPRGKGDIFAQFYSHIPTF